MAYNKIYLTFSYPAASTSFEFSTDGGKTYINGSDGIPIRYLANGTFRNYNFDINPIKLLFRKITNNNNFLIQKILFNNVSELNRSSFGKYGITGSGTQPAQGYFLAGKYVTYNSSTTIGASTGGVEFIDFKTGVIDNISNINDMQMVVFITGSINITFIATSAYYEEGIGLSCSFAQGEEITRTVHVGDIISFRTHAQIIANDWHIDRELSYFSYGIIKNDIIRTTSLLPDCRTDEYQWDITVDDIVWETSPAQIIVGPISFHFVLSRDSDTYWVTGIDDYVVYKLVDEGWEYTEEFVSEYRIDGVPISNINNYYGLYEYNGFFRFKQPYTDRPPYEWPVYNLGIQSLPYGSSLIPITRVVDWPPSI